MLASCNANNEVAYDSLLTSLARHWSSTIALSSGGPPACDTVHVAIPAQGCRTPALSTEALMELSEIAATLRAPRTESRDAARTHALGVLDLVSAADSTGLDHAVSLMRDARSLEQSNQHYALDLSAALLQRYRARRDVVDLLEVVDLTASLRDHGPVRAAACRNHAVALAWLAARQQVRDVVRTDARGCPSNDFRPPVIIDPTTEYGENAKALAASGRWSDATWDYATAKALPEWARAQRLGDSTAAASLLAELTTLGDSLARRFADSSITRAVQNVHRTAHERDRHAQLLRAVELYGELRSNAKADGPRSAAALIDSITASSDVTHEVRSWAALQRANRILTSGHPGEALQLYRGLGAGRVNPRTVFGGRLAFNEAISIMATGNQVEALNKLEAAAAVCTSVDRHECAMAAAAMASGIALLTGDEDRHQRLAQRALEASSGPLTVYRWTMFTAMRQIASAHGFDATVAILDAEIVHTARELNREDLLVDGLLISAREKARTADTTGLREDLVSLRTLYDDELDAASRQFHRADLAWIEGEYRLLTRQSGALQLLDSAVALMESDTNPARQLRPRLAHAKAIADEGDTVRALAAMDSLLVALSRTADSTATMFERLRRTQELSDVGSAAADLLNHRTDPARLLRALSGQSFLNAQMPDTDGSDERVDLAFRSKRDSVYVWSRHVNVWQIRSVYMPSGANLRSARWLDSAALAMLHEQLIAPILTAAGGRPKALRIDARGELGSLPWAALFDRASGRYLVETHAITLTDNILRTASVETEFRPANVLLIDAAPREGPRALLGAQEEVRQLEKIWDSAATRLDAAAGSEKIADAFPQYQLVHFAGHAILDTRRPERSHLELSAGADDRLTAARLAALQLKQTRLVVLAACDTRGSAGTGRESSGWASLASALHAAGAQQVIGAAWPIDDAATQIIMQDVHRALRDGTQPAEALRSAQLNSIHAADPARRSPRVWAAFQLMGR